MLIPLTRNYVSLGWGEFLGGGFHDDVIFKMQIKPIKSLSAKTRHRSEVHQQQTLHVTETPWANACIISLLQHVYLWDFRKVCRIIDDIVRPYNIIYGRMCDLARIR